MTKKMMRHGLAAALAMGVMLVGAVPQAKATAVIAATEPTQILNNIQLVASYIEQAQQTVHQYTMVLQGIENLKKTLTGEQLRFQMMRMFSDNNMVMSFQKLRRLYIGGQQMAYQGINADDLFGRMYPGYGSVRGAATFATQYSDWSNTMRDQVMMSARVAGFQEDQLLSEASFMNELQDKVDNPDGMTSAVQAGAQASMAIAHQMQLLRQIQLTQMETQNHFLLSQQSKSDVEMEQHEMLRNALEPQQLFIIPQG